MRPFECWADGLAIASPEICSFPLLSPGCVLPHGHITNFSRSLGTPFKVSSLVVTYNLLGLYYVLFA